MQSIETAIRQFVIENFLFGREEASLTADASFLENGFIDSTGVLELVSFLEKTYFIKVNDEEIVPENLDSISRLARFIERKRIAAGIS